MTKRTKRRIILMDSILIMSVAALCSSSFAWYMSLRQVSATVSNLALESGLNATLKYFSGNMNVIDSVSTPTGYKDPNTVSQGETKKSVTNYDTDFITPESNSNIFNMVDIFPDTRFTYAIELTSGFTSTIDFSLANYLPGVATEDKDHQRKVNNDSNDPVCLAEAIDIYVNVVKSDDNTTTLTEEANKVVIGAEDSTDNKLTDVFNFNYANHNGKPYTLKEFNVTTGITYYIFFTIEFSNDPDTYYSYESTTEKIDYYTKNPKGNSNVYQRLKFVINKLSILRI